MLTSTAIVQTAAASRYISQLCRHFAHKIEVSFDEHQGFATFAMGTCAMEATPEALILRAAAVEPAALAKVEEIVGVHLERFAFREQPVINWETGGDAAAQAEPQAALGAL